jgi:hypothetical protein
MTLKQEGQSILPAFPPLESHGELAQISSEAETSHGKLYPNSSSLGKKKSQPGLESTTTNPGVLGYRPAGPPDVLTI